MIKKYNRKDIQTVYKRHACYPGSVLYRKKGAYEWHTVPMDSGKWYISEWEFCFIELEKFDKTINTIKGKE